MCSADCPKVYVMLCVTTPLVCQLCMPATPCNSKLQPQVAPRRSHSHHLLTCSYSPFDDQIRKYAFIAQPAVAGGGGAARCCLAKSVGGGVVVARHGDGRGDGRGECHQRPTTSYVTNCATVLLLLQKQKM